MRGMIYSNLQLKDTEELLEIWTHLLTFSSILALMGQGIFLSLSVGISVVFGGVFCFIVLQAIAELIYLLMDIERNTRRKKRLGNP
jgi:heme exporter protein D